MKRFMNLVNVDMRHSRVLMTVEWIYSIAHETFLYMYLHTVRLERSEGKVSRYRKRCRRYVVSL